MPGEGFVRDDDRAGAAAHADVPRVGADATLKEVAEEVAEWELVVVVGDEDLVVGAVRAEAASGPDGTQVGAVMETAPSTVRPSITKGELAQNMDRDGEPYVLVTTSGGRLIGLLRREDLRG